MADILYCGNGVVFDGILTSMLSVMRRTGTGEPFTFRIFTMDLHELKDGYTALTERQAEFLDRTAKLYSPENSVVRYDVTALYKREFSGCPNENAYCSPYTLIRLLADIVLGGEVSGKLLYLDADIMFNRDVMLLYGTDVAGFEYAAARDHYGKYLIRPDYINAGVLLFNMDECARTGIFAKARDSLRKRKWLFADQDALWHSTSRKKLLPQRFNDQKFLWRHTVVRHFSKRLFWLPFPHTANIKQWNISAVHRIFGYTCFDDILGEYVWLKKCFGWGMDIARHEEEPPLQS